MKQKVIRTAAELVVAGVLRRAREAPLGLVQAALEASLRHHDDPAAEVSRLEAYTHREAVREAVDAVVAQILAEREVPEQELAQPMLVWVDPPPETLPRLSNFDPTLED